MGLFSSKSSTLTPPAPMPGAAATEALKTAPAPAAPKPMTTVVSPQPTHLPPAPQSERSIYLQQLKVRIHGQLVQRLDVGNLRVLPPDTVRAEVRTLIRELCQSEKGLINSADQERLMDEVMDETFGLGPLETLLKDPTISDILVNRCDRIYVERKGRIELSETRFRDNQHLRQIIDRIVGLVGRRVDETCPMVDARLADGSRVNAIIPPLALDGPAMSIRRFGSKPLQAEDLVRVGAFPSAVIDFLSAAVMARCNIIISGGTGSGKTTLLNCLSRYIPLDERVITIEDAAELQLQQPHVVRLETRPANVEGKGEVSQRDLIKNCLRMRPDRVVIGECRGGEALDMLQAMNTGHDGSMTTIHANNARDGLARLEVMVMMAGYDIPIRALRQQISAAVQLVVQARRMTGGRRKVISVSEICGMEGDSIQMHDLFVFEPTGIDNDGHATGRFVSTGIRPKCAERIENRGIKLPGELFQRRVIDLAN
ncbi:MAG TPA: CpaF family protein [Tepidisphaeraceae bacterium]|jgi:pilus assembly protein CpaF|nr:CpaF family protein [Tepidisphaeraceae bacterium]